MIHDAERRLDGLKLLIEEVANLGERGRERLGLSRETDLVVNEVALKYLLGHLQDPLDVVLRGAHIVKVGPEHPRALDLAVLRPPDYDVAVVIYHGAVLCLGILPALHLASVRVIEALDGAVDPLDGTVSVLVEDAARARVAHDVVHTANVVASVDYGQLAVLGDVGVGRRPHVCYPVKGLAARPDPRPVVNHLLVHALAGLHVRLGEGVEELGVPLITVALARHAVVPLVTVELDVVVPVLVLIVGRSREAPANWLWNYLGVLYLFRLRLLHEENEAIEQLLEEESGDDDGVLAVRRALGGVIELDLLDDAGLRPVVGVDVAPRGVVERGPHLHLELPDAVVAAVPDERVVGDGARQPVEVRVEDEDL